MEIEITSYVYIFKNMIKKKNAMLLQAMNMQKVQSCKNDVTENLCIDNLTYVN